MGRKQKPVPDGDLREFAVGLRGLRAAAGDPSYRALERVARYSASALSAAASGRRLPSLPVTLAYVGACGGDVQSWERRWRQLARSQEDPPEHGGSRPGTGSRPDTGPRPGAGRGGWSRAFAVGSRRWVKAGLAGVSVTVLTAAALLFTEQEPAPPPVAQKTASVRQEAGLVAFAATAGPACPDDGARSVHVASAPGGTGWRRSTGTGCDDAFLYSTLSYDPKAGTHPGNHLEWRFTVGLDATHPCHISVYVPRSPHAAQQVWYTVTDRFDQAARPLSAFTIDQSRHRGEWVPAPDPVRTGTGRLMVRVADDGMGDLSGSTGIAAGPIRMACLTSDQ